MFYLLSDLLRVKRSRPTIQKRKKRKINRALNHKGRKIFNAKTNYETVSKLILRDDYKVAFYTPCSA